eukprot:gene16109-biopygen12784
MIRHKSRFNTHCNDWAWPGVACRFDLGRLDAARSRVGFGQLRSGLFRSQRLPFNVAARCLPGLPISSGVAQGFRGGVRVPTHPPGYTHFQAVL